MNVTQYAGRSQEIKELEMKIVQAVKIEDYENAAIYRDKIIALKRI